MPMPVHKLRAARRLGPSAQNSVVGEALRGCVQARPFRSGSCPAGRIRDIPVQVSSRRSRWLSDAAGMALQVLRHDASACPASNPEWMNSSGAGLPEGTPTSSRPWPRTVLPWWVPARFAPTHRLTNETRALALPSQETRPIASSRLLAPRPSQRSLLRPHGFRCSWIQLNVVSHKAGWSWQVTTIQLTPPYFGRSRCCEA